MTAVEVGAVYRHYKGGYYIVLCVAELERNNEQCVVYKSLSTDKIWIRPLHEFYSMRSMLHDTLLNSIDSANIWLISLDNLLGHAPGGAINRIRSYGKFTLEELGLLSENLKLDFSELKRQLEVGLEPRFKLVLNSGGDIEKFKRENLL
jgi:hypothetical protein